MKPRKNTRNSASAHKISFNVFIFACAFFISSCESLPPGDPPQNGKLAEIIHTQLNQKECKTDKDAISYMLSSIVSKCGPISTASTINPPDVINDFMAFQDGRVNYMPMELWNNLEKMKMIAPVTERDKAEYILSSEFSISTDSEAKNKFLWKMEMKESLEQNSIWEDEISFIIEN